MQFIEASRALPFGSRATPHRTATWGKTIYEEVRKRQDTYQIPKTATYTDVHLPTLLLVFSKGLELEA